MSCGRGVEGATTRTPCLVPFEVPRGRMHASPGCAHPSHANRRRLKPRHHHHGRCGSPRLVPAPSGENGRYAALSAPLPRLPFHGGEIHAPAPSHCNRLIEDAGARRREPRIRQGRARSRVRRRGCSRRRSRLPCGGGSGRRPARPSGRGGPPLKGPREQRPVCRRRRRRRRGRGCGRGRIRRGRNHGRCHRHGRRHVPSRLCRRGRRIEDRRIAQPARARARL